MDEQAKQALDRVNELLAREVTLQKHNEESGLSDDLRNLDWVQHEIPARIHFIADSICATAQADRDQVAAAVRLVSNWMLEGAIVRIIGAGRARLAGSIPANRLAHGGARVYIQDDIIPMPHSIKGGGIIAVSASGRTESVLNTLRSVQKKGRRIKVLGIAKADAREFRDLCDVFIGIVEAQSPPPALLALADAGEQVINELLDAIVVAGGKLAGFDETTWRIGHEDLGPTGPYDMAGTDADPGHFSSAQVVP